MLLNSYYTHSRAELAAFLPTAYSRVLEVGCGQGTFRGNLTGGHEYWGVELSPASAHVASTVLDHVLVGTYEAVQDRLPDAYFDLVICNDVIEHMPDHDAFLCAVRKKIALGGVMVGSVPNVRHVRTLQALLLRRDWPYADDGVLDRTHLRFFTQRSFARVLDEQGYAVERLEGINAGSGDVGRRQRALDVLMSRVFGDDTRYLQFAFRARPGSTKTAASS